jgi:hypothetical protein
MSIIELMHQIIKEPAPRLGPEGRFSKDAEAFVDACLMKDVDERRTPGELIVSLLLLRHYLLLFRNSPVSLRFACSLARHLHLALFFPSSLLGIYTLSYSLLSSCSILSRCIRCIDEAYSQKMAWIQQCKANPTDFKAWISNF